MSKNSNKFMKFYKKNYKILMIIPAVIFFLSIFIIFNTIVKESTPIYRDISLKGGLSSIIKVETSKSQEDVLSFLKTSFPQNSFRVTELIENGKKEGFIIDTNLEEEKFLETISKYFNKEFEIGKNYSSNFISPTLSNSFFKQALIVLFISLVLMSIVIFVAFKEFVPSSAVVLSAIFDLIVTIGVLDIMKFEVSIAGIGALLMLIGYSIDTDVLLTNRLVKEFGDNYYEKLFEAFKTGVLMSTTTLVSGIAALILTNSEVIFEIALILVVGLIVDFVSTWVQNTGILLWWIEKKRS